MIFGYGQTTNTNRRYQLPTSTLDAMGNSYGVDSVLGTNGTRTVSFGVLFHDYGAVPNPGSTTTFIENKGFYACFWNNWRLGGDQDYTWGNHGTLREHNVGFADGHASPVLFEVRTDVDGVGANDEVTHSGDFALRGGTTESMGWNPNPLLDEDDQQFNVWAHLLLSGPGRQNHCLPAPCTITTNF